MDQSYGHVLTTYHSVTLSAEIAGIYCIYYVLVSYLKNISRFVDFEVIRIEEVDEQLEEQEEDDQDLDFDLEYFGV